MAESPPRFVHRDDAPLGIEQSDMRGQRVEDGRLLGSLGVTQVVLRSLQQERPAVAVRYRVHLACRQVLQTLPALVQRRDQRANFIIRVSRKG